MPGFKTINEYFVDKTKTKLVPTSLNTRDNAHAHNYTIMFEQ